jgi:hypothetical protein
MASATYRFYFCMDSQSFPADVIECEGDSDAMVKAKDLLGASTTFRLMEVWQSERKVGIVEREWPPTVQASGTDVE